GYRPNTDFNLKTATYGFDYHFFGQHLAVLAGFTDKKFGANSFYSAAYPDQWERTQTSIAKTGLSGNIFSLNYSGNIFWRYHTDDYMLIRANPSYYHNRHFTNVYGGDFQLNKPNILGNTSLGAEVIKERINSNNLGTHQRTKSGLFFEHQIQVSKWHFTLGSTLYRFSDWGWKAWPGLDVGYKVSTHNNLYASAGYAFRTPTYTELYYNSPTNHGDENLNAERGWNYELGWRFSDDNIYTNVALFRREGDNLIDWVWQPSDSLWQVRNITEVNTNGIELDGKFSDIYQNSSFGLNSVNYGYTYLNSEKNLPGLTSQYVLNYLRHQAYIGVKIFLFTRSLIFGTKYRFENRVGYGERNFVDLHLAFDYKNLPGFFINVSNVFDQQYEDLYSIPLPGRWIKVGINFNYKSGN
ncbi:MAG: TonB-dependent receptor, partial [Calditrichaceae bacterium]